MSHSKLYKFQIVYPSGTTVKARLWIYEHIDVMEIEIFPTSSDVQNTQGLCNKLGSKNFYARNGKISTIADFAKSWMYVYNNYIFTALQNDYQSIANYDLLLFRSFLQHKLLIVIGKIDLVK